MNIVARKFNLVEPKPKPRRRMQDMATDTNSRFIYTKGSDVLKTFKKYGFVPPTEYREDYLFKLNREASKPND
jgi:hypothetical protein